MLPCKQIITAHDRKNIQVSLCAYDVPYIIRCEGRSVLPFGRCLVCRVTTSAHLGRGMWRARMRGNQRTRTSAAHGAGPTTTVSSTHLATQTVHCITKHVHEANIVVLTSAFSVRFNGSGSGWITPDFPRFDSELETLCTVHQAAASGSTWAC
jgi:hypothetical protein